MFNIKLYTLYEWGFGSMRFHNGEDYAAKTESKYHLNGHQNHQYMHIHKQTNTLNQLPVCDDRGE